MELNNANSNGCNVVINNLYPRIFFSSKILQIELNKQLQNLFESRESISAHKLKLFITFDLLIEIERFKDFYVYINLEKQFQIFIFEKSDFFYLPKLPAGQKNNILGHNF